MRSISARYIVNDAEFGASSAPPFAIRIYVPPECYAGPNTRLVLSVFKRGVRQFSKTIGLAIDRLENANGQSQTMVDLALNSREASVISQAADNCRSGDTEIWLNTFPASGKSGNAKVVGQLGEVFRVDVTRGDQILFTLGEDADRLGARFAVDSADDLPSRSTVPRTGTNDAQTKLRTSPSLLRNDLSAYETDIAVAYYFVNMSTLRVVLMNIPPGFDRLQVLVQRTGDTKYGAEPIRKVGDEVPNALSSHFFSGQVAEDGNGFTKAGGYIVFDMQIRVDARNTISKRVNDSEQNFFLNLRNVNGDLISDNPRSALPLFNVSTVHAGQYANIRLKMEGGIGLERTIDVGETIGTMGYAEPRVQLTSKPVRLGEAPAEARIMTTITPSADSPVKFDVLLDTANTRSSDVFVNLGMEYRESASAVNKILSRFRRGDPILAGRQGGTNIVANIKRFDSLTGQTMDLGFISVDKFIDRVSDPVDERSVAALIGADSHESFLAQADRYGLTLIYTAEFYEITPEMIAAYLQLESADDVKGSELFSNTTNVRTVKARRLLDFISDIAQARTPLQQVALQVEYKSRFQRQPYLVMESADSLQSETNVPYNYIQCRMKGGEEYVPFAEVERVLVDTAFERVEINGESFGTTRQSIGFIPFERGRIAFRDFVPPDMVNILKNGSESTVKVRYYVYPYEYVRDNGLVGNTIRRREEPLVIAPEIP